MTHSFKRKVKTKSGMAVSNRWTGLWTGLVDWIAGLDYWIQPNCDDACVAH